MSDIWENKTPSEWLSLPSDEMVKLKSDKFAAITNFLSHSEKGDVLLQRWLSRSLKYGVPALKNMKSIPRWVFDNDDLQAWGVFDNFLVKNRPHGLLYQRESAFWSEASTCGIPWKIIKHLSKEIPDKLLPHLSNFLYLRMSSFDEEKKRNNFGKAVRFISSFVLRNSKDKSWNHSSREIFLSVFSEMIDRSAHFYAQHQPRRPPPFLKRAARILLEKSDLDVKNDDKWEDIWRGFSPPGNTLVWDYEICVLFEKGKTPFSTLSSGYYQARRMSILFATIGGLIESPEEGESFSPRFISQVLVEALKRGGEDKRKSDFGIELAHCVLMGSGFESFEACKSIMGVDVDERFFLSLLSSPISHFGFSQNETWESVDNGHPVIQELLKATENLPFDTLLRDCPCDMPSSWRSIIEMKALKKKNLSDGSVRHSRKGM